eukprot:9493691-Lingulodinium_polyedra.AAC.1
MSCRRRATSEARQRQPRECCRCKSLRLLIGWPRETSFIRAICPSVVLGLVGGSRPGARTGR